MLSGLNISNIVLIDEVDVSFKPGLCALTGETGAGKSIILDALGLILGSRSDSRLIRSGANKASVTASFDVDGNPVIASQMDELGLEYEAELILSLIHI